MAPQNMLLKTYKDIKGLKIQGASKVLSATIKAVEWQTENLREKNADEFKKKLKERTIFIARARPTEPAVRNFARYLIMRSYAIKTEDVKELREKTLKLIKNYLEEKEKIKRKIFEYGANKIFKGAVVLTHCHSNTVEGILKKAFEQNNLKEVYCTETRPLFQGRKTAENLADAGIPVTMVVDSAVSRIIKKADIFLSGADAVLADGSLVNKIGTAQISMICSMHNVPHYAATSTHKFDPITYFGYEEIIETRDEKEVWDKKPKNVRILNEAFDVTDARNIQEYITEKGTFSPAVLPFILYEEMEIAKNRAELSLIKSLMKKK